jgi:hypothetical protein
MIASAVTAPDLALRFAHDLASSVRAEALKAGCFKLCAPLQRQLRSHCERLFLPNRLQGWKIVYAA